jgi:hypothetical protein
MALERRMEPVVRGALEQGGLPREMAMAMGANTQANVIKPKGGNWLGNLVDPSIQNLKTRGNTTPEQIADFEAHLEKIRPDYDLSNPAHVRELAQMEDAIQTFKNNRAINKWVDSNLTNYVKKEMGTPEDPVRRLAEEGIIHTPLRNEPERLAHIRAIRQAEGFPAEGMGKSDLAKQWENLTDDSIRITKAGRIQDAANVAERLDTAKAEMDLYKKKIDQDFLARMSDHTGQKIFSPKEAELLLNMPYIQKAEIVGDTNFKDMQNNLYELMARVNGFEKRAGELNPFVSKLDPETRLYSGTTHELGFDHIMDVLREDIAAGRIRPEQLNKVSMEQAVRRTYEYDQELAKKMDAARLTARAELPVYKEYPEGLKWVELNRPGDFAAESDAMGHSVRGYEPPESHPDWTKSSGEEGHSSYGLGGWEAIKRGDAKVYSLVDAKGEPHVTIEVGRAPQSARGFYDLPSDIQDEIRDTSMNAVRKTDDPRLWDRNENLSDYGYQKLEQIKDEMARDWLKNNTQNKPDRIVQIKGKQNAKPKADYLPFVQDFVRSGNWSDIRDFQNTDLISADKIRQAGWDMTGVDKKYLTKQEYDDLLLNELNKPKGMKRGGVVISNNPDTMMLELNNRKMAGGGLTKLGKAVKAALKAEPETMKASEALGKIEGRPLVVTQSDRTKVGEGFLGGPGFSSLQLTEPEYRAAEAAWGVKTPGVAKMILGGGKKAGDNPVYTTMIGSPTQHQSNQMVFDKLYGDFKKAAKKGGLPTELRDKINDRLVKAVDKEGNAVFPSDVDIMDKKFKDIANTFDRRSIAGHLMGGVQVGGKKGQIIDYDKIIRETTDPLLIDVPSGSLGNRLFTLSGGIIDRPDLHPAFPTILQGEDLGLSFSPVAKDILMRDFIQKTMREKGRKPGYMDFTRGHPPSQIITEDILTEMQKLGLKEGGAVHKAEGGEINADDLIIEERPL